MKYKIGVFGSAVEEHPDAILKAKELGLELAASNAIVITGSYTGMPYIAAYEAAKNGGDVWGFSPTVDKASQKELYKNDDITIYSKIFYIPKNYRELFFVSNKDTSFPDHFARQKYRNVVSTANCDAGIIIAGRWGTLNEFTNLKDMGKIIGILTGTGGIADEIENLAKKINKPNKAIVLFNNSPKKLIRDILHELDKVSKHNVE